MRMLWLSAPKTGMSGKGGLYFFALLVTAFTLLMREQMSVAFSDRPLLILFVFPIIMSSFLGGLGPGLLATVVSALSVDYFLIPPTQSFRIEQTHDFLQWLMLIINGVLISVLTESLHRERRIVELRRLEQAATQKNLRESEERFRVMYESSQDAIMTLESPDWKFTGGNPATLALFQARDEDEFIHTAPWNLSPEFQPDGQASAVKAKRMIDAAMEKGSHTFEWTHRRFNGETFLASALLTPVTIADKMFIQATVRDITESKLVEEQKEQYHHRLESILDAAGEGIFGLNEEGKITFVNPAATKLFGYHEEELIGRKSHDVFHGNRQDGAAYPWTDCPNCKTMQDGKSRSGEELYYRKDGSGFPVEYNCTPISESGRITGVVVTFRDMTDRKKLEDQYRQAQKMEAIGQLAGGVAHDFNNILSAIIGYGNLAEMKLAEDNPVRHDLEQILLASERAAALTQSLLAFSRKQPLKMEILGLNTVIRRFEKFLLRLLREDIEMKTNYSETELPVRADRGQLEQIIMNLVSNARDAMPGKGELYIETSPVMMDDEYIAAHGYGKIGRFAMLSVSDTGIGMDEQTRRKIFEPFFTTKELGRGTGLGLATVYGIVRSHDGFIDVYSEPNSGTTFKIYFPVIEQAEELIEPEIQKFVPLKGGTETILLAEDDLSLRKLTSTILGHMGYTVIEAANGNEAVAKFIDNRDVIMLVILDGIMPGMNGKEVYQEITALSPDMRSIFMSGYAEDIFTKDGMLLNADDFLQKPVKPSELLNKVREVLDR